jgi:thiosulfate/3-mercaptopyruvate sulfurtransferase
LRFHFVDCRWDVSDPDFGRRAYLEGHIPGAAFLDVDDDLSDRAVRGQGRHPLPSAERFAATAGRAGIGDDTFVVAYGSMGGGERLWWLLRHFGHDACAVLLGGVDTWGGELGAGEEDVEARVFTPRPRDDDTIDAQQILGSAHVVVDARLPARWRGEANPIDAVPGRIPGALNAPWNEPLPELPRGDVVAYCGSGVTASVTVHRLWLQGREALLYPGSWSQWERLDLPVERD